MVRRQCHQILRNPSSVVVLVALGRACLSLRRCAGHTWTFFDIDYNGSTGGNGQLLEVAPDELIYCKCNSSLSDFLKKPKWGSYVHSLRLSRRLDHDDSKAYPAV